MTFTLGCLFFYSSKSHRTNHILCGSFLCTSLRMSSSARYTLLLLLSCALVIVVDCLLGRSFHIHYPSHIFRVPSACSTSPTKISTEKRRLYGCPPNACFAAYLSPCVSASLSLVLLVRFVRGPQSIHIHLPGGAASLCDLPCCVCVAGSGSCLSCAHLRTVASSLSPAYSRGSQVVWPRVVFLCPIGGLNAQCCFFRLSGKEF